VTASKSASLGPEANKLTKSPRYGFLGTHHPCFRVPVTGSQERREKAPQAQGCRRQREQPALPAGLRAAAGEEQAARSAPASRHLVNAINNVISAPHTSFSPAGGEFAKLQPQAGLEPPAAAPKRRGGVSGTQRPAVLQLPGGCTLG